MKVKTPKLIRISIKIFGKELLDLVDAGPTARLVSDNILFSLENNGEIMQIKNNDPLVFRMVSEQILKRIGKFEFVITINYDHIINQIFYVI